MSNITIKIHKDRFPKPLKALRAAMKKIGSKSPISIEIEKTTPTVRIAIVDPNMDGSPALPGELTEDTFLAYIMETQCGPIATDSVKETDEA